MLDFSTYRDTLLNSGKNMSQVRRNQSNTVENITFTNDIAYKRVYVLTDDGWEFVDAKYSKHSTPSITSDEMDYYLQFRPNVHFKLGTYVIVPDDTSPEINAPENPFDQPYEERTQWWLIVKRTDANQFVRYSILKCNWNFQWMYEGKIFSAYGCVRNVNSYTSGISEDSKSVSLNNTIGAWLPDVYFTYKNREKLGLDDIRTLNYGNRFMISSNEIHPKVYSISKIAELMPAGIVKISLIQDEFNATRDNVALRICDYYDSEGHSKLDVSSESEPSEEKTSKISWMVLNKDDQLVYADELDSPSLKLGVNSYFKADFSDKVNSPVWSLSVVDEDNEYTDERKSYFVGLLKLTDFKEGTISIKPSKAKVLIGKVFALTVSDEKGDYKSSIEIKVVA